MSTLNTTNIKHAGNTGDANLVLASDGTSTFNNDVTIDGDLSAAAGTFSSTIFAGGAVANDINVGVWSTNLGGIQYNRNGTTGAVNDLTKGSAAVGLSDGFLNFSTREPNDPANIIERVRISGGGLFVGGTLPASPNITLDANGEVRINRAASGSVGIPISILNGLVGVLQVRPDGTTNIGGSLPNSPNITLSADGSAAYRRAEGNVYINSSSSNLLQVATPADAERVSLTVGGDVRHFGSVVPISDQSLKENIVDASPQWDDVKNIKLRNYTWIDAPEMGQMLGVIAQELEKVSPGLISEDEKGVKGFKLNPLVMKMLGALQEAQARIEALEAANASLEARLTALEGGN